MRILIRSCALCFNGRLCNVTLEYQLEILQCNFRVCIKVICMVKTMY